MVNARLRLDNCDPDIPEENNLVAGGREGGLIHCIQNDYIAYIVVKNVFMIDECST